MRDLEYQCTHNDTGVCKSCFDFYSEFDKAYQILWNMFKSTPDKKSCLWDSEKEQKILNILNAIDNELER